MSISKEELPSNRKFGFFFALVFFISSIYFFLKSINYVAFLFVLFTITFLLITLVKSDSLQPLNRLWMSIGFLIGRIVSPIVLGIIYFGMFVPIALLMRIYGRDELQLRLRNETTYWVKTKLEYQKNSFEYQF